MRETKQSKHNTRIRFNSRTTWSVLYNTPCKILKSLLSRPKWRRENTEQRSDVHATCESRVVSSGRSSPVSGVLSQRLKSPVGGPSLTNQADRPSPLLASARAVDNRVDLHLSFVAATGRPRLHSRFSASCASLTCPSP